MTMNCMSKSTSHQVQSSSSLNVNDQTSHEKQKTTFINKNKRLYTISQFYLFLHTDRSKRSSRLPQLIKITEILADFSTKAIIN